MSLILFNNMSILMKVLSDMIVLVFSSIGVKLHLEYAMAILKYLPLATNPPDWIIFPSMVLFIEGCMVKMKIQPCDSHVRVYCQHQLH